MWPKKSPFSWGWLPFWRVMLGFPRQWQTPEERRHWTLSPCFPGFLRDPRMGFRSQSLQVRMSSVLRVFRVLSWTWFGNSAHPDFSLSCPSLFQWQCQSPGAGGPESLPSPHPPGPALVNCPELGNSLPLGRAWSSSWHQAVDAGVRAERIQLSLPFHFCALLDSLLSLDLSFSPFKTFF